MFSRTHRFDDISFLKEAVFATVPECQVTTTVGDQQIVVEWMERGAR